MLISSCHFDARLLDVSSQSNADGPDEDRWFGDDFREYWALSIFVLM